MELRQQSEKKSSLVRSAASVEGAPPIAPAERRPRPMWKRIVTTSFAAIVWLYLALLLAMWLVLYFYGDSWWLATIMLFGPRWVCGLPLAVLVPAATIWRRRLLWPLAVSA